MVAAAAQAHTGIVSDMCYVPTMNMLVTAGMDGLVHVWDAATCAHLAEHGEHEGAVRCAVYHAAANVVLTTSFDNSIMGWDMNQNYGSPLFRLTGHKLPVIGLVCVERENYALSVDEAGTFKWWDVRRSSGIADSERCLQTFWTQASGDTGRPFQPRTMAVVAPGWTVVVAGPRVHSFELTRLRAAVVPQIALLFNHTELAIFTAGGSDVSVYSAASHGERVRCFPNIMGGANDITSMVFDHRDRKFIVASAGGSIEVFNCLNGAVMKSLTPHAGEVTQLVYVRRPRGELHSRIGGRMRDCIRVLAGVCAIAFAYWRACARLHSRIGGRMLDCIRVLAGVCAIAFANGGARAATAWRTRP